MDRDTARALLALHLLLAVYSLAGVCGKLAAGRPFLSLPFCLWYGGALVLLGLYALGWQQVIKRLPLTAAYASKAVTVIWGILWGALLFHEEITAGKLAGAMLIAAGVLLFSRGEGAGDHG